MTTDKIYTTLRQIRNHSPREDGYEELCKYLGGIEKYDEDTPVTFKQIYESNGYKDTLCCLCTVDEKWFPLLRHYACDCADDVRHLMIETRLLDAVDTSRCYADGLATIKELSAARDAAKESTNSASAAWATYRAAAWSAVWAACDDAPSAASNAASWASICTSSKDAYKEKQMQRLFEYCRTGERVR